MSKPNTSGVLKYKATVPFTMLPLPANIFFELYAKWPIVPGRSRSTVNFATWKNKSPTFGQIYYCVYAIHETQHPIRLSDWLPEAGNPIVSSFSQSLDRH